MALTKPIECPRCGNKAPMKIVAEYEVDGVDKGRNPDELSSAAGETWRLLVTPKVIASITEYSFILDALSALNLI